MKNVSDFNSLTRAQRVQTPVTPSAPKADVRGPSFQDALTQIQKKQTPQAGSPANLGVQTPLKFSNHALERMRSRGIAFGAEEMGRLQSGVEKAAQKGSRDSLVLMGDSAFVVSVTNKTVVTVMDRNMMKDNVFTNIDSTVVL